MSLTENGGGNGLVMPVAPMYAGGSNGGNSNGWGGDNGWCIILLFLFALGGWGNGFGGGNGGGGNGFVPYLYNTNTGNEVQRGFDQAAVMSSINALQSTGNNLSTQLCNCCSDMQMSMANGFANTNQNILSGTASIQNSLCNGFNGVNTAINGAQNAVTSQLYNNEIANLNRSFAEQTANMQGFNAVNSGIADTRYTIASEACATRQTDTQNTQNILNVINGGIQSIKDQLCQDKIDAKNDEIAQLRQEVLYARGQASQVDQTAQLLANNNAQTALFQQGLNNEVDALYNRLQACPVNTVPVYGRQPIFNCNNNGCGCGCGNSF